MISEYEELSRKLALLEIATLLKYEASRPKEGNYVYSIGYKDAYQGDLQSRFPFSVINWDEPFFRDFKVLMKNPPKKLKINKSGEPMFVDMSKVTCWCTFIDSFRQLRNNLVHGAKFLKEARLDLEDRDEELIKAGLAFIKFLEYEKFIDLE